MTYNIYSDGDRLFIACERELEENEWEKGEYCSVDADSITADNWLAAYDAYCKQEVL